MTKFSYGERDYSFGQLMLTLRTHIGLTQARLGALLGVSRRAVAEWEAGSSYPTVEHLKHFVALAVKERAFTAGHEAEDIRALWKAAHLKVLLDEQWLKGLLLDGYYAHAETVTSPVGELVAPLIGRTGAFNQLVTCFLRAKSEGPQAVFVIGEAGIGKTRLTQEFALWVREQKAQVVTGRAIEMAGRLPYQPLIEVVRESLEPIDTTIEPLWLVELSRLLPQLRLHYPNLPTPVESELTARIRFFEAVAHLLDTLVCNAPLLLLLEDLHWADGDSLDLLHYLARHWSTYKSRVLLLGTMRPEALSPISPLVTLLNSLGRDLPLTQVVLRTLSQEDTFHLVATLLGKARRAPEQAVNSGDGGTSPPVDALPSTVLGEFLFAQTGGQPLYMLELLKLLRERELLVPHVSGDGSWYLEPTSDIAVLTTRHDPHTELLPPSIRTLIHARLTKLGAQTRQLVMAAAILGTPALAQTLWQVADLEEQVGIEALEEAIGAGILLEEETQIGHASTYRFSHDLIRNVVYADIGTLRRQVLHRQAFLVLQGAGCRPSTLAYHALLAGDVDVAYHLCFQAGLEAAAAFAIVDAIGHYEQARSLLEDNGSLQASLSFTDVECLYTHLGGAYVFQNKWSQAWETYERLLSYAREHDLFLLATLTLNRLAILSVQQAGRDPRAQLLLEDALRMAQSSHDQQALAETEWNWAQIMNSIWDDPDGALPHGKQALALARANDNQELEARALFSLGYIYMRGGDFLTAMHSLKSALDLYATMPARAHTGYEISLPHIQSGAALTQSTTNNTAQALCWGLLTLVQMNVGEIQAGLESGRRALSLAQATRNAWAQVLATMNLVYGLLDTGAYEEALGLMQPTLELARALPPTFIFQRFLFGLGRTYHALQQWEQARAVFLEAEEVAEALQFGRLYVPTLSQLCMNYAETGDWETAYHYALKASALRRRASSVLILQDFTSHYETRALLHGDNTQLAREEVRNLELHLGPYQRYRIPYLRSRAMLAVHDGDVEHAIHCLQEAGTLAHIFGFPEEQWQIQAMMGTLYEVNGALTQARAAATSAAIIITRLAEGIGDRSLRAIFLGGLQVHPVLHHNQRAVPSILRE